MAAGAHCAEAAGGYRSSAGAGATRAGPGSLHTHTHAHTPYTPYTRADTHTHAHPHPTHKYYTHNHTQPHLGSRRDGHGADGARNALSASQPHHSFTIILLFLAHATQHKYPFKSENVSPFGKDMLQQSFNQLTMYLGKHDLSFVYLPRSTFCAAFEIDAACVSS